jgi:hypothetical protein
LLKGFENSTIWQSLQEDQDRSVPSTSRLEARTGRRNAVPETPSDLQEISGVCACDLVGADEAYRGGVEGQVGIHYLYAPRSK